LIIPTGEDSSEYKVELKPPKEVPSDSLQNPSDEDATYSGHKGQGYHAQLTETCAPGDEEEGSNEGKRLSLIVSVHTEGADKHDGKAVIPAIKDMHKMGINPKTLLGDTNYGSDENVLAAAELGVELVSPVSGKSMEANSSKNQTGDAPTYSLADFYYDQEGAVIGCPNGVAAETVSSKTEGTFISTFDGCGSCPQRNSCPIKIGKTKATLRYSIKEVRLARRRLQQETQAFKSRYRMRSGIEATNSQLARQFGLKRLWVRGLKAVGAKVIFKALALNVWRVAIWKAQKMA
jgi:hypothetical protein